MIASNKTSGRTDTEILNNNNNVIEMFRTFGGRRRKLFCFYFIIILMLKSNKANCVMQCGTYLNYQSQKYSSFLYFFFCVSITTYMMNTPAT